MKLKDCPIGSVVYVKQIDIQDFNKFLIIKDHHGERQVLYIGGTTHLRIGFFDPPENRIPDAWEEMEAIILGNLNI